MSRYVEGDCEGEPEQILAWGRWERNARATLKGKRGRKALAELREALMALPEHRLIDSALCTAGDMDARLPERTPEELADWERKSLGYGCTPEQAYRSAEGMREDRELERAEFAKLLEREGEGVCAIGAWMWHQKVQAGMDPQEAFAALPLIWDDPAEGGGSLEETARAAQQELGIAYTLAWELTYRNDETYANRTPEERWTAFVAWIDKELAGSPR